MIKHHPYSEAPYMRTYMTTADAMVMVIVALLPSFGSGIYNYGSAIVKAAAVSVVTALVCELVMGLIVRRKLTVTDYSALVTGLIGAMILPPNLPLYFPAILSASAILIFKWAFGGTGRNILNPAAAGRAVLLAAFYPQMHNFSGGQFGDLTPLQQAAAGETPSLLEMILGHAPGSMGCTGILLVILGAVILFATGIVDGAAPAAYLAGFAAFTVLFGDFSKGAYGLAVQIAGGSMLFVCFFMLQDFTTSPVSFRGRVVYGLLCGVVCGVLRRFGLGDDAAFLSVLAGNLAARLIDLLTIPKPFGMRRRGGNFRKTSGDRRRRRRKESEDREAQEASLRYMNDVVPAEKAGGSETDMPDEDSILHPEEEE